ncbi:MAG: penicillin acylase family protein [Deltaproteobacteria bacterium]|nr:penicillin acylase family protein [Deltaproteobacteria bacterium]
MTDLLRALAFSAVLLALGCGDDDGPRPGDASTDGTSAPDGAIEGGPTEGGTDSGPDASLPEEPLPAYEPSDAIEILYDDRGIPHVFAATDEDAYYAAGYAMATDRLFQMELNRRRAYGRWSEVLGEARERDDELSLLLGFARDGRRDADALARDFPQAHALVVAWAAGINRRIDEIARGEAELPYGFGPDALDFEPAPWRPSDVVSVSRMSFFATSNTLEAELFVSILRLVEPESFARVELLRPLYPTFAVPEDERPEPRVGSASLPPRLPAGALPVDAAGALRELVRVLAPYRTHGSNNWAVAGAHTANGRSMLANDPHLPLESPSLMYALHVNSAEGGGTFDVAGFTFAGSIGVALGHNARVAWAATTSFADAIDVWEVEYVEGGVRIGDRTVPVVEREETVRVRSEGGAVGDAAARRYVVTEVPGYGVILPRDIVPIPIAQPRHALLMRWAGFDPIGNPTGLLALQRAGSLDELEEAFGQVPALGFNFVGADADGIVYRVGQAVPDRGDPATHQPAYLVMDGDDPDAFWSGALLPPERLPHSRDPARGWLATANNDPLGFTENGRVDDDPWYYGAYFDPGFRARRISDELTRLTARGDVTADEMRTLQTDAHSTLADALLPMLAEAFARVPTDPALSEYRDRPELARLVALLTSEWDRQMRRESAGALAFHVWAHELARAVLEDDVGVLFGAALDVTAGAWFLLKVTALALQGVYPRSAEVVADGTDATILAALASCATWLTERYGSVDPAGYAWGDAHRTWLTSVAGGALDLEPFASDGGEDTINNAPSGYLDGASVATTFLSDDGPLFRSVVEFDEDGTPRARIAFVPGNAGDPTSEHFRDELDGWAEGSYGPLLFRRGEIEAATERRVSITP